ncbi:unnamed protein product [marine sediment metagenome]|uniref:Uncharacterized protein n=1 Tax=marine sediment metagenome TaxID=412755 RepID=X1FI54_9ZZZZ
MNENLNSCCGENIDLLDEDCDILKEKLFRIQLMVNRFNENILLMECLIC